MATEPGSIVTFYSFKGGTGRTMAVANAGYALAGERRGDVLMIDWDLEAPGLHDFFPELSSGHSREGDRKVGVLELFEEAHALVEANPGLNAEDARKFWEMMMDLPGGMERTDRDGLHLLRAGRMDENYGERVRSMRWQRLFELWPDLFKAFAEQLASHYRFVLIDSRTGLSDTAGICTSLLPDRLVAVFTPNRQSLSGVTDLVRRAVAYRGESADLRRLLVFPLASRVEMSEDRLRHEWRYGGDGLLGYQPRFERLFEDVYDLDDCNLEAYFDEVQIQHATSYAYGERVALRDEDSDRLSLSRSYERFTRVLLEMEEPWALGRSARMPTDADFESGAQAVLAGIEEAREWHAEGARKAKFLDNALLAGVLGIVLGGLLLYLGLYSQEEFTPPFTPWIISTLLLAGLLAGARSVLTPHRRYAIHARAANALARESTLFEARAGHYADADAPIALLAERLVRVQGEADDALVGPGSGFLRPPSQEDR